QALSRGQQAQLLQFQRQKLRTRKDLREVQHQLNADIEAIGSQLKQLDILGMPALVLLAAIVIALRRRWRRRGAEN
ncbi:MAG: ABC transporter, partial [Arenimonas sp.]